MYIHSRAHDDMSFLFGREKCHHHALLIHTVAVLMYIHIGPCMYILCTGMVNTATICMYRHGTYPGLPGSVPLIPYSLHMLTTSGTDLLGQSKGIVGQLGALLSCTTLCSLS